jgi:hypothetical protein
LVHILFYNIKKVVISTRRGTWIFNRVIQRGLPYDVVFQSRFYDWLMAMLPWSIANDFHEWRIQQRMFVVAELPSIHRGYQFSGITNCMDFGLVIASSNSIRRSTISWQICLPVGRSQLRRVLIIINF